MAEQIAIGIGFIGAGIVLFGIVDGIITILHNRREEREAHGVFIYRFSSPSNPKNESRYYRLSFPLF